MSVPLPGSSPAPLGPLASASLRDGRRAALFRPTSFELEKTRTRHDAGEEDPEDENNVERNFWVTFIRKNPMRKANGMRPEPADWGDADPTIMGPNGPSFIGKVFRDPMSAKVKLVYDTWRILVESNVSYSVETDGCALPHISF